MRESIANRLADLLSMSLPDLRANWEWAFARSAPRHLSRDLLLRALAYHVQEQAEGGLTRSELKALTTLAMGKIKTSNNGAKPGTRLLREWRGVTYEVIVLPEGYLWRGQTHKSLSSVARAITGTNWSGPRFFGL